MQDFLTTIGETIVALALVELPLIAVLFVIVFGTSMILTSNEDKDEKKQDYICGITVFASNIFIKGMAFGRPHCQYMWNVNKLISVEINNAKLKWHLAVPSGTSPNAKVYGITLFG